MAIASAFLALNVSTGLARADTSSTSLTGDVRELASLTTSDHAETTAYEMLTASGRFQLVGSNIQLASLDGTRARVTGRVRDGSLDVVSAQALTPPVLPTSIAGTRDVAVIPVRFTDSPPRVYYSDKQISDAFFKPTHESGSHAGSVHGFFDFVSGGAVQISGRVFPTVTVSMSRYASDAAGQPCPQMDAAWEAYRALGSQLTGYEHVMALTPDADANGCPGGAAYVNHFLSWSGSLDGSVLSHELSHNLGRNHAGAYACRDDKGNAVPLADECALDEYGDNTDVMGGSHSWLQWSAPMKERYGFLAPARVADVTTSGTYELRASDWTDGPGLALLRVPRRFDASGAPSEWLEAELRFARSPYDQDNQEGVNLHVVPAANPALPVDTILVDGTPDLSGDIAGAKLIRGEPLVDPVSGVSLTVEYERLFNMRDAIARVHVDLGGGGTASVAGGKLKFSAAPSTQNDLQISSVGSTVTITGRTGSIVPGAGCARLATSQVKCKAVKKINVRLRGADDTVVLNGDLPAVVNGGGGNDTLSGGGGRDRLDGGLGDDVIDARGGGSDVVVCAGGRDTARGDAFDTFSSCEFRA